LESVVREPDDSYKTEILFLIFGSPVHCSIWRTYIFLSLFLSLTFYMFLEV